MLLLASQCTVIALLKNFVFDRFDQDTSTKAWPSLLPPGRTSLYLLLSGREKQLTGSCRTEKSSDSPQLSLFPVKIFQVERTFKNIWKYKFQFFLIN